MPESSEKCGENRDVNLIVPCPDSETKAEHPKCLSLCVRLSPRDAVVHLVQHLTVATLTMTTAVLVTVDYVFSHLLPKVPEQIDPKAGKKRPQEERLSRAEKRAVVLVQLQARGQLEEG